MLSDESGLLVQFLLALGIVLLLILLLAWVLKKINSVSVRVGLQGEERRLSIKEALQVDQKRRLILVKRDQFEHLILVGGENDLLIEHHIPPLMPVQAPVAQPPAQPPAPAHPSAQPPHASAPVQTRRQPVAPMAQGTAGAPSRPMAQPAPNSDLTKERMPAYDRGAPAARSNRSYTAPAPTVRNNPAAPSAPTAARTARETTPPISPTATEPSLGTATAHPVSPSQPEDVRQSVKPSAKPSPLTQAASAYSLQNQSSERTGYVQTHPSAPDVTAPVAEQATTELEASEKQESTAPASDTKAASPSGSAVMPSSDQYSAVDATQQPIKDSVASDNSDSAVDDSQLVSDTAPDAPHASQAPETQETQQTQSGDDLGDQATPAPDDEETAERDMPHETDEQPVAPEVVKDDEATPVELAPEDVPLRSSASYDDEINRLLNELSSDTKK